MLELSKCFVSIGGAHPYVNNCSLGQGGGRGGDGQAATQPRDGEVGLLSSL